MMNEEKPDLEKLELVILQRLNDIQSIIEQIKIDIKEIFLAYRINQEPVATEKKMPETLEAPTVKPAPPSKIEESLKRASEIKPGSWEDEPATEKQKQLLRQLIEETGAQISTPVDAMTKGQASKWITTLLEHRKRGKKK